MGGGSNKVSEKINSFKKKYYLNLLIKGSILTATFILGYFIIASIVEYNLWLGKIARFIIFSSFFILFAYCVIRFLKEPLAWWFYKKGLNEEQSAQLIGRFFPDVGDKLLNVIQLAKQESSVLAQAGIEQKSESFRNIAFETAIDLRENRQYLKYLAIPFLLIIVLWFFNQGIFTQSTSRIVKFNQEFTPSAPFDFILLNKNLDAYFNEDFSIKVQLSGEAIPQSAYIQVGQQRWKMEQEGNNTFSYTFEKLQQKQDVQIEASGFLSDVYQINLVSRPELNHLKITLDYPSYLGIKKAELLNAGNLQIPEGTKVTWQIAAANTQAASINFAAGAGPENMQLVDDELFIFSKNIRDPDQYSFVLENESSKNKDRLDYSVEVIKDQFPQISVENMKDSVLYSSIYVGGTISDDYGLTQLKLNYQIIKNNKESDVKSLTVPVTVNQPQQNFFYQWKLDSIKLDPGDKLSYHLQVWDNDGVNGRKSSRSASYMFSVPSKEDLITEISKSEQSAESKIDQSLKRAKDLKQSIEEAQQKIKGKQSLDWQDKKMLEDLIQQREKLNQAIDELQKENELLEQKKESFTEESERIKEKSEQIQKLMNELLDDETRKMFQELEKLLKENADPNQLQKMLDKLDRKEINLEKELERTLELFKQLKYDFKVEQTIQELKDQIEKQSDLLEKTEDLTDENKEGKENDKPSDQEPETAQDLAKKQEELQKDFENFEESLKDLEKLSEELNKDAQTPDEENLNQVEESQEQSKQELQKGSPKKSSQQQKKSIDQMKQMQQQMESMQSGMEMEMDMQNLESLRQIIHGLIKLSFDQESLMKEFGAVQQTDPRYVALSQDQLKVKDDAKVLEDSLLALAKKDPFMGSVVTREIGELNEHLDKSVENVKERRKSNASSEMQFSMTSINNLALMLNDHYNMMMNMMANAMPGMKKGKKGQKPKQSLSKMQEMLNQQMEQVRKGGKSGRQLSEEMARMAAEQERIRRALEEMEEKLKNEGGKLPGGDLPGKMEQTEFDLVNKQITEQTIRRQKEILTRLLDAEKSMREQDLDEERKGETAKDYGKDMPKAFEEYLKLKEKEVELLRTLPPKLYPYYKKEVNEYFKRIGTQN